MNPLEIVIPVEATGLFQYAWLMIAIPLGVAAILLLGGRATNAWGHWLGVLGVVGSFAVAAALFAQMLGADIADRAVQVPMFEWISVGNLHLSAALLVDQLSILFALLVTGVGSLIFIYSVGYMAEDPNRRRFFAFMNIFIAAMLTLVLADGYGVLFVGWEGVGLASYLLIGFWQQRRSAALAAKKAFVVNRIGDLGLLVAMFIMVTMFGSLNFTEVNQAAAGVDGAWITAIGFLLLLAACGKSAQVPLQSWLLDAMEGPTPVSALIHAATMVTAGVYLVVRSNPIYNVTPEAQLAVAVIGAITLVFGAVVGSAKDDMKKVLAASTMSQIGYMMLAAGLGPIGYAFAIFHLFTHGFFKAGMFLGAGSVMHSMNDQVNMRRFGALWKPMMVTWATFGFGWLAILGIPPFSGFFSKDKIIEAAFVGEGWQPWVFGWVALLGAGLTAFYMSRMFFMIFHGKARWTEPPEGPKQHPHESPKLMTVPMILLAIGSIALGGLLAINDGFTSWLEPVTGHVEHGEPVLPAALIMTFTLAVVVVGIAVAYVKYVRADVPQTAPYGSALTRAARKDLYQDAFNEAVFMRPGQALTKGVDAADEWGIDGAVEGIAVGVKDAGQQVSKLQTGYVRTYASYLVGGAVLAVVAMLAARM